MQVALLAGLGRRPVATTVPTVNAQAITATEDVVYNGQVSASQIPTSYAVGSGPSHGVLNLNTTTGAYTYTPAANYSGSDSFTVTATNGFGTSAAGTISVTVTAVNDAPVSAGQSWTTSVDTAATRSLSATDIDSASLTYSIVSGPSNGTISGFNASTGAFTYTPGSGYTGSDSFTWQVTDGALTSATATETITVSAGLPTGSLVGVWYASDYDSTKKAVPNRVAGSSPSANILRNTQRIQRTSYNRYWGYSSVDRTYGVDDGLGGFTATRFYSNSINFGFLQYGTDITFPAGTKTMFIEIKSNTTPVTVKAKSFGPDTFISYNVTTAWQTIAVDVSAIGAGLKAFYPVCTDGTTDYDVSIRDIRLVAGTTDPGRETLAGHMYFGTGPSEFLPTVSGGSVDFNGAFGMLQLPLQSPTAITLVGIFERPNSGDTDAYSGIISEAGNDYDKLAFAFDTAERGYFDYYGKGAFAPSIDGFRQLRGLGPMFMAKRVYPGTGGIDQFVGAGKLSLSTGTGSAQQIGDFLLGHILQTNLNSRVKFKAMALYYRALSDAEVLQAKAKLMADTGTSELVVPRMLITEGDSITTGFNSGGTQGYPTIFAKNNASPLVFGHNGAVPGTEIAAGATRLVAWRAFVNAINPTRKIYSIAFGANDLCTNTANGFLTALAAQCDILRAEGAKVVVCTVIGRNDTPASTNGFAAKMATVNAELRLWTTGGSIVSGIHADAIADFAGNAAFDTVADADNATYYGDQVHPTGTGQALLETIFRAAVNGIS